MIRDILTVMWKERNALFAGRRNTLQLVMTFLVPIGLAVYLPWDTGPDWVKDYLPSLIVTFALPLLVVGTMVPDAFAGERERKTLESLLATRLPDRAILFGKLAVAVAYGWSAAIVALVIGVVVVNVVHWTGGPSFYAPRVLGVSLCLGFLTSVLTASLGVIISLRAKGVREAQQLLTTILILPPMIAGFAAAAFADRIPEPPSVLDGGVAVGIVLGVFAFLCVVFVWIAVIRFRRDRLILD
jgi:ABC-2 type transport system permease protein